MREDFDATVVGGGIIGLLTAWRIAKSGKSVLLLEQHSLDRSKGSSRGTSRMFGEIHQEDIYYQLARRSKYLWREIERETGKNLLFLTGGLDIASSVDSRDGVKALIKKLRNRHCSFEVLDNKALNQRYPQWRFNSKTQAIYSPNEGILKADDCMDAAIIVAKKQNLTVKERTKVVKIDYGKSENVFVKTSKGEIYGTRKLIITAGPWASKILNCFGVNLPLSIYQVQTVFFKPRQNFQFFTPDNFPVWEFEGRDFVYGFPVFEKPGIKAAFHNYERHGRHLNNVRDFRNTPDKIDIGLLRSFLKRYLPDAAGEAFDAMTCLYIGTSDQDFVIDTVRDNPQIIFFTGDSGHAFHCAPAVAETLTELAIHGKTTLDISPFSLARFKL